jgi:alanine dehydrogenase
MVGMTVGIPKEIKNNENRVGVTPEGVAALVGDGHQVRVEAGAGLGCGCADAEYASAGATVTTAAAAWQADLVIKVKEPLEAEYPYLGGQIVFTYFHLAGVPRALTEALLAAGTTAVAYETVEDDAGRLPLLAPMSAVAGSMAPIMGSYHLAKFGGGRGVLPGQILGATHGKVAIIGDGVVGRHAAVVAAAMRTRVLVFGRHPERAAEVERIAPGIEYVESTDSNIAGHLRDSDLLVGGVLARGARAQRVVSEAMVQGMPEGSVIVDVSIDQGGCVATSRPTSHADPVFTRHGVIHYCVTNMPGAYPRTSTVALTAATLPYARRLAKDGLAALSADQGFARGLNTHRGSIRYRPVAEALGMEDVYHPWR